MMISPEYFTGDMPLNAFVGLECSNRPDQMPFINAINEAKQQHDDDQIVMTCKCPPAFEWRMNHGWDAEDFSNESILKNLRIHTYEMDPWVKRQKAWRETSKRHGITKRKDCIYIVSQREIALSLDGIHVTLDGTPTSNPKRGNVFEYIHHSINYSSDFILDSMEEGSGLTGLYSSCEYKVSHPTLDTWADEKMDYIWEQYPISRSEYTRSDHDLGKFMKAIVRCVAVMMHEYQTYHIDIPTAWGLTPDDWRVWCMQWHMYKRDYEIARTHLLIPEAGCSSETVCVYLETLMKETRNKICWHFYNWSTWLTLQKQWIVNKHWIWICFRHCHAVFLQCHKVSQQWHFNKIELNNKHLTEYSLNSEIERSN